MWHLDVDETADNIYVQREQAKVELGKVLRESRTWLLRQFKNDFPTN